MTEKIEQLMAEVRSLTAASREEAEALRVKYLGKKGLLNELMADFRQVPAESKKAIGIRLNELKALAQERIAALRDSASCEQEQEGIDRPRRPGPRPGRVF
ncbi:MAG: phenylalanine--tRNA ligase subunit alpha, partial [Prevotellaceae bacterium]|nr:phenylalanine--tRNA ligase subunit alpha [Prevotellaceae bacterium]